MDGYDICGAISGKRFIHALRALVVECGPNPNDTRSSCSPKIDCEILRTTLPSPLRLRYRRFEKLYTVGFADVSASSVNPPSYTSNENEASDGNFDKDVRIASGKFVSLSQRSRVDSFLKLSSWARVDIVICPSR